MKVRSVRTDVYRIPTDKPEADGTLAWDSTTVVAVEILTDSDLTGMGFTYASAAAATAIQDLLAPVVEGADPMDRGRIWGQMLRRCRNAGLPGIAATAVSAVDIALWDLNGKILNSPVAGLLPVFRPDSPIYGSGGFTSYSDQDLREQLTAWVEAGINKVKIKIGKDNGRCAQWDVAWTQLARKTIGDKTELFVDANGAYSPKQAIAQAVRFADFGVTYFEEPVSSDHLDQLRFVRDRAPMDIAAGEYGYTPWYFRSMLSAEAVDILQADATRCLGITGWLEAAALAHSHALPISAHTAPAIHAQIACAAPRLAHLEYFHDHQRIEKLLFDGLPQVVKGRIRPNSEKPGLGLELRRQDAEKWKVRG